MWLFIEMEKEGKKTSHIFDILFSMETCKTIQKIDSYTFELKKRKKFFAKERKEENLLRNYLHTNQLNTNKNNGNDTEVEDHITCTKQYDTYLLATQP